MNHYQSLHTMISEIEQATRHSTIFSGVHHQNMAGVEILLSPTGSEKSSGIAEQGNPLLVAQKFEGACVYKLFPIGGNRRGMA